MGNGNSGVIILDLVIWRVSIYPRTDRFCIKRDDLSWKISRWGGKICWARSDDGGEITLWNFTSQLIRIRRLTRSHRRKTFCISQYPTKIHLMALDTNLKRSSWGIWAYAVHPKILMCDKLDFHPVSYPINMTTRYFVPSLFLFPVMDMDLVTVCTGIGK